MKVREALNLMDDEVWVRVRVNDVRGVYDLVLWSPTRSELETEE